MTTDATKFDVLTADVYAMQDAYSEKYRNGAPSFAVWVRDEAVRQAEARVRAEMGDLPRYRTTWTKGDRSVTVFHDGLSTKEIETHFAPTPPSSSPVALELSEEVIAREWDAAKSNLGYIPYQNLAGEGSRGQLMRFARRIAALAGKRGVDEAIVAEGVAILQEGIEQDNPSANIVRRIFALASRGGERERGTYEAFEREAAREALTKLAVWYDDPRLTIHGSPIRASIESWRDREYPAPQEARRVVLSDGRVFERGKWEWRNGKDYPHTTFDIVTNKDKPGCEHRICYESVEQMREQYHASWADWQLIDAALTGGDRDGK